MNCSYCGFKSEEGDIYCGNCGHKLSQSNGFPQPQQDVTNNPLAPTVNWDYPVQPPVASFANDTQNFNMVQSAFIYVDTSDVVNIFHYPFVIGKDPAQTDYAFINAAGVSRVHAKFICQNGRVYIVDMNSTNHTYVNGNMLRSGETVELHNDDQITLYKTQLIFKC